MDAFSELVVLSGKINDAHWLVQDGMEDSMDHAVDAGQMLLKAKQAVKRGQWGAWVDGYCIFSDRTARKYMRLARNACLDELKRKYLASLALRESDQQEQAACDELM